ncbi:MAG TPA: ubiquitin-like domain-containing protein, partial [Dehalococcoidia bacterium]|nr:ubiquitin-like domain-containing protein [Dehalococcoidia bacterium]
ILEDGRALGIETTEKTLEDALKHAGIRLGPADEIYPAPSAPVTAGMQVEIHHARMINLHIGDSTRVIYTQKTTLADALAEAGLSFSDEDRIEPALDATVTDGMDARLVRVDGETYSKRAPVKHVTVFKPDDSLTGTQTRRVEGSDGVQVTEYKITIEDGVETQRTFSKQYYEPEPVDTVIYYAASSLQGSGLSPSALTVQKTLRMYGTWYDAASSGKASTSGSYGVTASGMPLTRGIVAVDPSVIALGTRLYIPGYGFAVAADTGGGIVGNRIDLGFPDGAPVDWNTGWTDVYILSP